MPIQEKSKNGWNNNNSHKSNGFKDSSGNINGGKENQTKAGAPGKGGRGELLEMYGTPENI